MDLTSFVPARRRLTAAITVGAMALTVAGLHAPGVGAASQQPPACETFIIAGPQGAQGSATGSAAGDVQAAPGAQQAPAGGQVHQAGQPATSGAAPEVVSCVVDPASAQGELCVGNGSGVAGQPSPNEAISSESGTTDQVEEAGAGVPQGGTQQAGPGQHPGGAQVHNPNEGASTAPGAPNTQSSGGAQGGPTGAPAATTGGSDVVTSAENSGETAGPCGGGDDMTQTSPANVIESPTGSGTTNPVPTAEQAPPAGCEETVISEYPLPTGGSIKVTMTPC